MVLLIGCHLMPSNRSSKGSKSTQISFLSINASSNIVEIIELSGTFFKRETLYERDSLQELLRRDRPKQIEYRKAYSLNAVYCTNNGIADEIFGRISLEEFLCKEILLPIGRNSFGEIL